MTAKKHFDQKQTYTYFLHFIWNQTTKHNIII